MPELPEVETVRRTLEQQILNEVIKDVKVYYDKIIENVSVNLFICKLKNERLIRINRYGKYLIFIFEHVSLISHLRMEGKFFIKNNDSKIDMHEHIIFEFESGNSLRYHDTRKFGKMALIESTNMDDIMNYPSLKKLGLEANSDNLTPEYLYEKLTKRTEPIKSALLNQEIIAGLGNIYVDEVCFLSKIHPLTSCKYLTMEDAKNIIKNSKEVLTNAINAGGTTIRSYTSSLGVTGRFQLSLHVHTLVNKPCEVCHTLIKKIIVGGRGTYYCPFCQKQIKKQVIGITGGIAMGKSIITSYLTNNNYFVIDSDEIVKKLLKTDFVKTNIKSLFGNEYVINNEVNKKMLASKIFNDDVERNKLNNLIHPLVLKEIKRQIKASSELLIFVDVPLLYEASFDSICNQVIVIYTDYKTNIDRLMKRDNIDESFAKSKISSQMDIEIKKQKANYLIDNSLDLCYTYKQLDDIIANIINNI